MAVRSHQHRTTQSDVAMAGFVGSIDFRPTSKAKITQPSGALPRGFRRAYQECSPYPPLPAVELQPTGSTDCPHVQLLANEEQTVFLIGSGSISNHVELQRRLEGRAHRFASSSSLETAVHAYEDEGMNCLALLSGQFALAIWDQPRRKLVLACDSLGQKTVYYAPLEDRLVFATRLDAVRLLADKHQVNARAIDAYLTFGFVPRPLSMIDGIHRLRPGNCLSFEQGRLHIDVAHRWSLPEPLLDANARSVSAALRNSVRNASGTRRPRIWNDHTLSSRLVAAASDLPIESFDRRQLPTAAESVTAVANLLDEPVASLRPADLLAVFGASNAPDEVTLTGVGGSEALLTSPHYAMLDCMQRGERLPQMAWQLLSRGLTATQIGGRGDRPLRRRLTRLLEAQTNRSAQRHLRLIASWSEQARAELYRDEFVQQLGDDPARFLSGTSAASEQDSAAAVGRDLLVLVPDRDLAWIDQVFSSQNASYRHPWLDEAVLNQSISFLLGSPWGRASRRQAIAAQLGVPLKRRLIRPHPGKAERFFRTELAGLIRECLLTADAACASCLHYEKITALVRAQFVRGGLSDQIVSLLMLELCLRRQRAFLGRGTT